MVKILFLPVISKNLFYLGDIPCRVLLSVPDSPEVDKYFEKLDGYFQLVSLSNAEYEYGPLYRHTDKERVQQMIHFLKL